MIDIKGSHKRTSKIIIGWWILTGIVLSTILLFPYIKFKFEITVYLVVWFGLLSLSLFLSTNHTYSSNLKKFFDILEAPIYLSLISLFLIAIFGLAPFFDSSFLIPGLSEVDLIKGLLMIGEGLISFWCGYILTKVIFNRYIHQDPSRIRKFFDTSNPSFAMTIGFYAVLLIFRLILLINKGGEQYQGSINLGIWNQWMVYLVEIRWLIIPLILLMAFSRRWSLTLAIVVFIIEGIIAVFSGWSATLPRLIIMTLACVLYSRKHIPMWLGILSILLIIVSIPIARSMRDVDNTQTIDYSKYLNLSSSFDFTSQLVIDRQMGVLQIPALIRKFTPKFIPYRPVSELLLAPLNFIPRSIWPSKPAATISAAVTYDYLNAPSGSGSAAPTIFGSAFMYGGDLMIILGLFALGVVFSILYYVFMIPGLLNNQIGYLALYSALILSILGTDLTEIYSVWQMVIQKTVIFMVILFFLSRTKAS